LFGGRVQDAGPQGHAIDEEFSESLKLDITRADKVQDKCQEEPKVTAKSEQVSKGNQLDDLTRAPGDFAVYEYYFRHVGWSRATILVASVILNVFCSSFSRK
jgi:hypothetical protein